MEIKGVFPFVKQESEGIKKWGTDPVLENKNKKAQNLENSMSSMSDSESDEE
jgi:hypothetical protein